MLVLQVLCLRRRLHVKKRKYEMEERRGTQPIAAEWRLSSRPHVAWDCIRSARERHYLKKHQDFNVQYTLQMHSRPENSVACPPALLMTKQANTHRLPC